MVNWATVRIVQKDKPNLLLQQRPQYGQQRKINGFDLADGLRDE